MEYKSKVKEKAYTSSSVRGQPKNKLDGTSRNTIRKTKKILEELIPNKYLVNPIRSNLFGITKLVSSLFFDWVRL